MKKILLFSVDPGGANCIIPVANRLANKSNYQITTLGQGSACLRYNVAGLKYIDIRQYFGRKLNYVRVEALLDCFSPDLIITGTSENDLSERYLWKAANKRHIPSIAILDYWANYKLRFSNARGVVYNSACKNFNFLPDIICIMDELAKKEMIKEGFPEKILRITGQPHIEEIIKHSRIAKKDIKDFRNRIGIDSKTAIVTFVSEPISTMYGAAGKAYYGYDEKIVLGALAEAVKKLVLKCPQSKIIFIIRPHPKDSPAVTNQEMAILKKARLDAFIDRETISSKLIQCSDLVVGMSSFFLIEAAMLEKPFLSVQLGLKIADPSVLSRMGKIKTILKKQELFDELEAFLLNSRSAKRIKLTFTKGAGDSILNIISDYAGN